MADPGDSQTFDPSALPLHAAENRRFWDERAHEWVDAGVAAWAQEVPTWGAWSVADDGMELLPADMSGMRAIELGCGTGYISGWMARRGAEVVAIDVSSGQLATARRLAEDHGADITFIEGSAESVPEPDASFDFAISEYGAAIWCDPHVWLPEAARLLRPGGQLVFLGNHPLAICCIPLSGASMTTQLARPWFGLHRVDWTEAEFEPGGIEFNLPTGEWLRLFQDTGFDVDDLFELQAPDDAPEELYGCPSSWAKQWPSEQVWRLTKR